MLGLPISTRKRTSETGQAMATPLVPGPYPTPRKTTSEKELNKLSTWIKNSPNEAYRAISQIKSLTPPSAAPPAGPAQKTKLKLPHPAIFEGERESWLPFRNRMMAKLRSHGELSNQQRLDYWVSRIGDKPSKFLESYLNEHGELLMSEHELVSYFNLLYINSNQKNDDLAEYERLRMRHPDKFIDFFMDFWRLLSSQGFHILPFRTIQYELIRRLPKRLRQWNVYINMDFENIQSLRHYFLRVDSHFHRENKLSDVKSKPVCTKISLKALLKVKRSTSSRLFSAEKAIEVAHERKVTHIQEAKLEKMTPSEYDNKTPSEHTNGTGLEHNKATPSVLKEASLDHGKVISLEVAHIDVHEDAPDKLDEVHLRLLRPKRLGRIRHARCKAWVYEYGLALDIQENAWVHDHGLTLDEEDSI